MLRFRTISHRRWCKGTCVWLLVAVLGGGLSPVFAEEQGASEEFGQVAKKTPKSDARQSVISGLDEYKLSQRFPDAALWLDLEDGSRSLAMLWPEREVPARGGLIILADEGDNAESGLTGTLARELAQRNIAVMSLGLEAPSLALEQILERPVDDSGPVPDRDKQNSDVANPATIDVMASDAEDEQEAAYRKRIRDQLLAGVAALEAHDYELIAVVGIGRGSNHVVLNAAQLSGSPAMIWISPKLYPKDHSKLATALDKASIPRILELSSSDEYEQRRAGLKRAKVEGFSLQLMGLGDLSSPRNGKALAGRISAWLKPKR